MSSTQKTILKYEDIFQTKNESDNTMVDYRTNYAKDITDMLHDSYGDTAGIMKTYIPFSVKAAEASTAGISIYKYCPTCKVTKSYEELTKEVMES